MNEEKAKSILAKVMPEEVDPFRYGVAHGYLLRADQTKDLIEAAKLFQNLDCLCIPGRKNDKCDACMLRFQLSELEKLK